MPTIVHQILKNSQLCKFLSNSCAIALSAFCSLNFCTDYVSVCLLTVSPVAAAWLWLLICTNIIPGHSLHIFYSLIKLHYNPDFTKCEMLVPEGQWHIPGYISCSSPTFTSVPTYLCSSLG